MTIEPVGYLYEDGYWCETDALQSRFNGTPVYTAEALAAAWEQGRAASAEAADSGLGQSMSSYGQGHQAAAVAIRALPNPHKHGSE